MLYVIHVSRETFYVKQVSSAIPDGGTLDGPDKTGDRVSDNFGVNLCKRENIKPYTKSG